MYRPIEYLHVGTRSTPQTRRSLHYQDYLVTKGATTWCPSFLPVPTNVHLQRSKALRGEEWGGGPQLIRESGGAS